MNEVTSIGSVPWTREEMCEQLEEFASIYEMRPVRDNAGGMRSPHLFLTWFVLKKLKPKAIIESGVWLGQGTWFFEKTCPDAELHCIDLNLERIRYKSNRARYYNKDFSTLDWSNVPKEETILFFDDHQNAYERVKLAKWFGFRHLLFEDNYPPSQGNCYSLKKAFMHSGFTSVPQNAIRLKVKEKLAAFLKMREFIPSNDIDAKYLRRSLDVYCELPPIFKPEKTRWGDLWDDMTYPTPPPLLTEVGNRRYQIFLDEAVYYTWICYVKLR
ncbi:MAG: hypothetical protein ACREYF_09250 [Gammaproteobacteria bacterium]